MSTLEEENIAFDFCFPSESIEHPSTPPPFFMPFLVNSSSSSSCNDNATAGVFLDLYAYPTTVPQQSHGHHHARSSSHSSVYSSFSATDSVSTVLTASPPPAVVTPQSSQKRSTPPIRQHGPLLLPRIRSQDQDLDAGAVVAPSQVSRASSVMATPPPGPPARGQKRKTPSPSCRPVVHNRSYTNPETLNNMAYAHMSSFTGLPTPSPSPEDRQQQQRQSSLLLCSPASFAQDTTASAASQSSHLRRASSCSSVDAATIEKYGYPTYRQASFFHSAATTPQPEFHLAGTPEPISAPPALTASTTLINYLTAPNPAPCLVRTVAFPLRDPQIKHFWWDVRNISSWSSFTASHIFSLPGASSLLTTPIPTPALVHTQNLTSRHPETEAQLHSIFASYYLPKVNSALACSSRRPVQLSVSKASSNDLLFTANVSDEPATAASIFGGKPTARAVGLVRSFERFNTQMRTEGNIKRVEYLRGLAALHHAMREHSCRYGFILTEIELVLVRNGTEATPFFGELEITSVDLAADASQTTTTQGSSTLTACLALWGLCQMVSGDEPPLGHAHWRSDIGAPAEGTRRKARPRDKWMPQPQLAEKREAKRSRGWILPEDAVGRKELGKRGVRYGNI